MRKLTWLVAAGLAPVAISTTVAAQGHIAGGVAGAAVAGKHHRVAGAVVGGAVGHHMAKQHEAKKQAQQAQKAGGVR